MIANPFPGRFITFEGLDGSGLTSQADLLTDWIKNKEGVRVELTKEPTDGPAGGQIRMALDDRLKVDETTIALLFAADRMDHLHQLIVPRLKDGIHVVCDRYYLSSFAYQSVEIEDLSWLFAINSKALRPDLTIVLQVPPSICVSRMSLERFGVARYEKEPELKRVWESYERVIPKLISQGEFVHKIEAGNLSKVEVQKKVLEVYRERLKNGRSGKKPAVEEQAKLIS